MYAYIAYIFDEPQDRETDVRLVVEKAVGMGYQVRYWWSSNAAHLHSSRDRLIVCVCQPHVGVDTGMDLYWTLREAGAAWDELETASPDEWTFLGRQVGSHREIRYPRSIWLLFGPDGGAGPFQRGELYRVAAPLPMTVLVNRGRQPRPGDILRYVRPGVGCGSDSGIARVFEYPDGKEVELEYLWTFPPLEEIESPESPYEHAAN